MVTSRSCQAIFTAYSSVLALKTFTSVVHGSRIRCWIFRNSSLNPHYGFRQLLIHEYMVYSVVLPLTVLYSSFSGSVWHSAGIEHQMILYKLRASTWYEFLWMGLVSSHSYYCTKRAGCTWWKMSNAVRKKQTLEMGWYGNSGNLLHDQFSVFLMHKIKWYPSRCNKKVIIILLDFILHSHWS